MGENRRILYGYTVRNGKTVIEPTEAGYIRKIFEEYINGSTLKDIADSLTAERVPFTIKSCGWDKARVARIIENASYTGDAEYDPIIGTDTYEMAIECKKSRLKAVSGCSHEIEVIGPHIKCERCGHPMMRRICNNRQIRESWTCQNPECKASVRLTDYDLTEKVRVLMNRVIQNSNLLLTSSKYQKPVNPEVEKLKESITAEMKNSAPSESLVLDLIGKIASEEYKSNCSREAITARLAQHRVDYMTVQSTFNETYFNDIVKTVLLSESGSVRIITKTNAEIGGKEET